MRYYKIVITNPQNGQVVVPQGFGSGLLGGASYTSFVNGKTLPGAWNVELDVPVIDAATSQGFSTVRIWGISVQEIGQANKLAGYNVQVFGGMQKGLPLANPSQAGLLVSGVIYQAFGNWIDTAMTLDLVVAPGPASGTNPGGVGTLKNPKNLVLNWKAGTPLSQALRSTLQTAFPGYSTSINVNAGIVRPNDEVGFFPTLEQLAQYCRETSLDVIKTTGYLGVSIVLNGSAIAVTDSPSSDATQIDFVDLIGQPTWLDAGTISAKTVMRADLACGRQIKMPPAVITNSQQAQSSLVNQKATFQGGFVVTSLRHVGNYRQPSADSWVTVIEAAPNQLVAA